MDGLKMQYDHHLARMSEEIEALVPNEPEVESNIVLGEN